MVEFSTVTAFQLFAGAARASDPGREVEKIQKLIGLMHELPFDADAARHELALGTVIERSIYAYDASPTTAGSRMV